MIWHPLLLAVLLLDVLGLLFAMRAMPSSVRCLLGWQPETSSRRQIALEAASESASLAMRYALFFFGLASLLLLLAISYVLPRLVPGAMCGTGVMTAMHGLGGRALALRVLALIVFWGYASYDGLNRASPRSLLTLTLARWQLLTLPFLTLAVFDTARAILALDPEQPVSCCQAVYDQYGSLAEASHTAGLSASAWLWLDASASAALGALVMLGLWRLRRSVSSSASRSASSNGKLSVLVLLTTVLWLPVAAITLVRVLAAYHYQVLSHHCPWCLFLPEHGAVGYLLYAALLASLLEATALVIAARCPTEAGELQEAARRRQRRALLWILLGLLVFVSLSAGPAILWRLEHGVWMHR